jgi:hypothetical protein
MWRWIVIYLYIKTLKGYINACSWNYTQSFLNWNYIQIFLTPKLYTEDENDETFDFAYGTNISVSVHVWIQYFLVYQKNCQDLDSRCNC